MSSQIQLPSVTGVDAATGLLWFGSKYIENKHTSPFQAITEGFLLSVGSKLVNQVLSFNENFAALPQVVKVAGSDLLITGVEQKLLKGKSYENSLINAAKYSVIAGASEYALTGQYAYSDYVNQDILSSFKLSPQKPGVTNVSEKA